MLYAAIGKGDYEIPAVMDLCLADLMRHLLDVDAQTRYNVQEALAHPSVVQLFKHPLLLLTRLYFRWIIQEPYATPNDGDEPVRIPPMSNQNELGGLSR